MKWPYDTLVPHPAVSNVLSALRFFGTEERSDYIDTSLPDEIAETEIEMNIAAEILAAASELFEEVYERYRHSLKSTDYKFYLKIWHWHLVRMRMLARAGEKCQLCNGGPPNKILNVHHRTYVRRGEERPEDLTVLCSDCHKTFHNNSSLESEEQDPKATKSGKRRPSGGI